MAYYLSCYYSNSCKLASFFGYSGSLVVGASTTGLTSCLIGSYLTTTSGCLTGYGLAKGSIFISGSFG